MAEKVEKTLPPCAEGRTDGSGATRQTKYSGDRPWRFPLWQVSDQLEFFAYTAGNRADGVCLIERIDLPDQRVVIACLQVPGNPGSSITNCVEEICTQVCRRFRIAPERLVWL
jgi:hypothetical protein